MKDSTTDVHKTIYNEKLKNRIVSENRDFSWHPLSFYTRMFWAHFSTLHTWPKGYWLKHYNKYFVSIQFILEGEMTVTIDKNEYVIKAGEAVVIPPGTCRLAASGTNGCRKFYFIPDGQLFYSIIRQLHFDQLAIVSGNETPELVELREKICYYFEQKNPEDIPAVSSLIFEMLTKIAEKLQRSNHPEKLTKCLDYIQKHISEPLSLERLAAELNISKTTLKELFAKHLNSSPGKYICDTRLNYAKTLLAKHDLSIKNIAFLCGYESPLYFSNAFRGKFGISPREYRKSNAPRLHKF
ncbi:MAG: helix-turn-helix transcriptional regulator [Lentisphaeria bacterium]|nr:helix-turn-helix transcriptional regulator [Lentisphaeria bacterium]